MPFVLPDGGPSPAGPLVVTITLDDTHVDAGDSLTRLRRLVSPHVGVIRGFTQMMKEPHDSRLVSMACQLHRFSVSDERNSFVGHGPSLDHALAAALGEAAERHSIFGPPVDTPVLASARDIGAAAVSPSDFALFSDAQYDEPGFRYERFTDDARVCWVAGRRLPDGTPAFLPSQLVYMQEPDPAEVPIAYATSSGAACAGTLAEAVLGALLEVIERDAFMITWRNRLELPRVRWRHLPRIAEFDDAYFAPSGLDYDVIDLSAIDDVPTMLAVVRPAGRLETYGIGLASAVAPEQAWWRALREAFASNGWLRYDVVHDPSFAPPVAPSDVHGFGDHLFFFRDPERLGRLEFLTASSEASDLDEIPSVEGADPWAVVDHLASKLYEQGVDTYFAEITAPEIAAVGLHVVRVVAPQLCAIDAEHRYRFLGASRLAERPIRLGYEPVSLNCDPHPMP